MWVIQTPRGQGSNSVSPLYVSDIGYFRLPYHDVNQWLGSTKFVNPHPNFAGIGWCKKNCGTPNKNQAFSNTFRSLYHYQSLVCLCDICMYIPLSVRPYYYKLHVRVFISFQIPPRALLRKGQWRKGWVGWGGGGSVFPSFCHKNMGHGSYLLK